MTFGKQLQNTKLKIFFEFLNFCVFFFFLFAWWSISVAIFTDHASCREPPHPTAQAGGYWYYASALCRRRDGWDNIIPCFNTGAWYFVLLHVLLSGTYEQLIRTLGSCFFFFRTAVGTWFREIGSYTYYCCTNTAVECMIPEVRLEALTCHKL